MSDSDISLWVTLWLVGAAVCIALFVWTGRRYAQVPGGHSGVRPYILLGVIPCGGLNVVLGLIAFAIFMARAVPAESRHALERALAPRTSVDSGASFLPNNSRPPSPINSSDRRTSAGQRGGTPAAAGQATYYLGEGRRFRGNMTVAAAVETLTASIESYRESPYETMALLNSPGFVWQGAGQAPDTVVGFDGEGSDASRFVAFWSMPGGGIEAGMFRVPAGDMMMPEVGRWVMAGASLTSTGTWPAGSLGLTAPRLSPNYLSDMIKLAGYVPTPHNQAALEEEVASHFLLKGSQFLTQVNAARAAPWVEELRGKSLQQILDALAREDHDLIPYIADLPDRIGGLLIAGRRGQVITGRGIEGTVWERMDISDQGDPPPRRWSDRR